jgi:hypothetical protein
MLYSEYYLNRTLENPNLRFIKWINKVEQFILEKYKVNLLDIPDHPYMELFENGLTPNEMVEHISIY